MKHGVYVAVCSLFSVLAPHRYINPHKAPAYWQESEKKPEACCKAEDRAAKASYRTQREKEQLTKTKEIQEFNFSKTWPGTTQVQ